MSAFSPFLFVARSWLRAPATAPAAEGTRHVRRDAEHCGEQRSRWAVYGRAGARGEGGTGVRDHDAQLRGRQAVFRGEKRGGSGCSYPMMNAGVP